MLQELEQAAAAAAAAEAADAALVPSSIASTAPVTAPTAHSSDDEPRAAAAPPVTHRQAATPQARASAHAAETAQSAVSEGAPAPAPALTRAGVSAGQGGGGHSGCINYAGFRTPPAFTRPAHMSLRARLQRTRSDTSRSARRSSEQPDNSPGQQRLPPVGQTDALRTGAGVRAADATVGSSRGGSTLDGADALAYGRLAHQMRYSEGDAAQPPSAVQLRGSASEDGGGGAAGRPGAQPRLSPESEALRRMLVDALLMLGYLHLDGEGTKRDNKEAVGAMRRAAALGSDEARRTLGWLYNTGQFGE